MLALLPAVVRADLIPCDQLAECYQASIPLRSSMPFDGTLTVYLVPGSGLHATESQIRMPFLNGATLASLACRMSDTTGAQTVTLRARTGVCTAALIDSAFVCQVGAGQQQCDTGALVLSIAAGECLAFRLQSTGALPGDRWIDCSLERIS